MFEIENAENLIEEVESQALTELDDCLENLEVSYREFLENPDNKEIQQLYKDAENDLKILLAEYANDDLEFIQEAYMILFEEIEKEVKES